MRRHYWTDDQERLRRGSGTDRERVESEGIQGEAKISKARAIDQGAERDWRKCNGLAQVGSEVTQASRESVLGVPIEVTEQLAKF